MMMRLRRASVIAALSLLAWAATAYAECAWVVWEDTIIPNRAISTEAVRAYNTKTECDRGVSDILAAFKNNEVQIVTKDMLRQEAYVKTAQSTVGYRYVCLPDTVDPRGPKGK